MPSRPSRNSSRSSSSSESDRSTGGSLRRNELSLNLYSELNGHWGTMVYRTGERAGQLYHVRSNTDWDDDKFWFESRRNPVESQSSFGRSVLSRYSDGERQRVESALQDYGSVEEHIPRYSTNTNCQTFIAGAYGRLEDDGLLAPGNASYFRDLRGRHGKDIGQKLVEDGRSWIPTQRRMPSGPADARFGIATEEHRPRGRLNIAAFEDALARRVPRDDDSPPHRLQVPSPSRTRSRSRSGARSSDPVLDPNYFNRSAGSSSGASSFRPGGSSGSRSGSRSTPREFDDLPGPDFFSRG